MSARIDRSSTEAEIRRLIERRLQAIRTKDAGAALACCAPDVLVFDLAPPLQYRGADVNRKSLEEWFTTFQGPVGYELRDLAITASDEVAVGHGLARITGARTDGTQTDVWVRTTMGLRKSAGAWTVTHEHVSVPFEMVPPFRASLDLEP